ncbi:hypothetical protein ACHAXR_011894 [Thalassiosira sp. AJA248-18]
MDHNTKVAVTPSRPHQAPITTVAKTIHLIRHGVARHNVPDALTGERPNLHDPKFTDPSLIRQGELQARVLGEHLRRRGVAATDVAAVSNDGEGGALGGEGRGVTNKDCMDVDDGDQNSHTKLAGGSNSQQQIPIELIVCSPLTRCLQTASLIFPSYFASSAEEHHGLDKNVHHRGVLLKRNCRVCCHGDVREAYGMHYPDKRSPLSQLKSQFPNVTYYHPSLTEHDDDWQPDTRETREDVSRRIHNFLCWLVQQPHDNIAVVTHGVWMECALLNYCPEALEFGKKRVYNCQVFGGKLVGSMDGNGDDGVTLNGMVQMAFHHA